MKRFAFCLMFLFVLGCGDSDEDGGACEVEGRWQLSYVPVNHACELGPEVLSLHRDANGEWDLDYGPSDTPSSGSSALSSYFFYDSEACAVEYEASVGWTDGTEEFSDSRSLELSFTGTTATGTLERGGNDPCLEDATRTYEVRAKRL